MPWSLTGQLHCTKLDNKPQRKTFSLTESSFAVSEREFSCLINCTYLEVKEDPRDSRAGIWAKSLLMHLNPPQLRKICMCGVRLGVHIFMVTHWHLECLHWQLVSFRACFYSLQLFSLCNVSSVHFSSPDTRLYESVLFHETYIGIPAGFCVLRHFGECF